MNLIFLGLPGSGKGTIAKKLGTYTQISTGDLLRKEIASGSELGKEIARIINGGNLVSDELALQTIESNIEVGKNYIFDGFPRTYNQAIMLEVILKGNYKAVLFDVDKEKLRTRLINRRTCPSCGEIYNLVSKAPQKEDTCDKCSHVGLTHRDDDKAEVLDTRFGIFEKQSKDILSYYSSQSKLITLNADDDIDVIYNTLLKSI
jgi:adenylate kinase